MLLNAQPLIIIMKTILLAQVCTDGRDSSFCEVVDGSVSV